MRPDCGCCEGIEVLTPLPVANRPGLSALRYRVGTHASFLASMLARLTAPAPGAPPDPDGEQGPQRFPLTALTTRDLDDPAVALLDSWATVADVLTFYQERLANEGYLKTATERRSILELARLVGYKLRAGVAASVYLAYTLEDGQAVTIPAGSRAQSVPGPGEKMEAFETGASLDARAEWNALEPRTVRPQDIQYVPPMDPPPGTPPQPKVPPDLTKASNASTQPDTVYFKGTATNLKPGDRLLFVFNEGDKKLETRAARAVNRVTVEAPQHRTRVDLEAVAATSSTAGAGEQLRARGPTQAGGGNGKVPPPPSPADVLGRLLPDIGKARSVPPVRLDTDLGSAFGLGHTGGDRGALTGSRSALLLDLRPELDPALVLAALENAVVVPPPPVKVYALRKKAFVYGNNAPPLAVTERGVNAQETVTVRVTVLPGQGGQPNQLQFDEMTVAGVTNPVLTRDLKAETFAMVLPNEVVSVTVQDTTPAALALQFKFLFRKATVTASVGAGAAIGAVDGVPGEIVTSQSFPHPAPAAFPLSFSFTATLTFITELPNFLSLDAVYDQVVPQGWLVIERPPPGDGKDPSKDPKRIARRVQKVSQLTRTEYGVTAKVTRALLDQDWLIAGDDFPVLRQTTVYAQSGALELADEPVDLDKNPVGGSRIELDGLYDGLQPGRWLIVTGERVINGTSGVSGAELVMLDHVEQLATTELASPPKDNPLPGDKLHSFLVLANALAYTYRRDSVTIYGNVVEATHGQTCAGSGPPPGGGPPQEVLGSGDGTQPLQEFTLRQSPLTYVPAATPDGTQTTLQVRVNGVLWREAGNFVALAPTDRAYVTRTGDDDKTTVTFGDGVSGARLPTGTENVTATYRFGLGAEGNVKAGQISLLATRPLGVKSVTNPLAATGGADREGIDEARDNTPRGLSFLERLVSVRDYEDFARASAGIGRARATPAADAYGRPAVNVVVAGSGDIPIDETSELFRNLHQALTDYGDPAVTVQPSVRRRLALLIAAQFAVSADYLWDDVAVNIRAALLDTFGFGRRDFGQPAYPSEVIRAVQDVDGVIAVHLEDFRGLSADEAGGAVAPGGTPAPAQANGGAGGSRVAPVLPAWNQIAYLSPAVASTLILKVLPL
jgi:hypothetical protein